MTVMVEEVDQPEPTEWDILQARLIRLGRLSPEGVGRRAQPGTCRRCGRRILTGLDDDVSSLRADADPGPVTALGEMLAHLEHRRTYALVNNGGRLVLDYRDAGRITHRPAGASRLDILVEHRCGSTTRFPAAPSNLVRSSAIARLPEGAPCPF
jgi:hypothetical protein